MLHVGLDLSRRKVDVCLLSQDAEIVEEFLAPSDTDGLRGLTRRVACRQEPVRGVIESMTGARFVHDQLEELGWDVLIADAAKVKGLAPWRAGAFLFWSTSPEPARPGRERRSRTPSPSAACRWSIRGQVPRWTHGAHRRSGASQPFWGSSVARVSKATVDRPQAKRPPDRTHGSAVMGGEATASAGSPHRPLRRSSLSTNRG